MRLLLQWNHGGSDSCRPHDNPLGLLCINWFDHQRYGNVWCFLQLKRRNRPRWQLLL